MPYYEYRCAANGRTLEVRHAMGERLTTWGQLARAAEAEVGDTPPETPVERLLSTPVPFASGTSKGRPEGGCGSGCACVPQA